jgi:hypothetical protein
LSFINYYQFLSLPISNFFLPYLNLSIFNFCFSPVSSYLLHILIQLQNFFTNILLASFFYICLLYFLISTHFYLVLPYSSYHFCFLFHFTSFTFFCFFNFHPKFYHILINVFLFSVQFDFLLFYSFLFSCIPSRFPYLFFSYFVKNLTILNILTVNFINIILCHFVTEFTYYNVI